MGERVNVQEESAAADFCDEKNCRKESPGKPPHPDLKDELGETMEKTKDRDDVLAQVERKKRLALIKAWEDHQKTKADNKAHKKLCAIDAWENSKRALVEAQLKKIEENFEKKKAEYAEKMKNKVGGVLKTGEEKKAKIEADRGLDFVMVEEAAAKFRATGNAPSKLFACFSC